MAVNRLLYFGVLILSAVFYFASSLWFSWVLVVLLLAAPIVSLLVSLPAMLSCRFSASIPDTVEQGEKAAMHMTLHAWRVLPLPEVQARLNLRTRDVQKDTRYLSHLSRANGAMALSTETCGFIAPEFRRARVYDALGLFALPVKMPKLEPMVILPPPLQPDPMPRMDQFLQQQMKAKPGGGFSELHDNRPYRPGDLVKDIHWKLSLKTDELIVREAQEPLFRRMVLAPEHELVQEITTPEQRAEVEEYITRTKNRSERERMAEVRKVSGAFTGAFGINPITGAKLPIWIADYVLMGYGTGAIMAVPAHDSRDFAFARHFNLPIIQVVNGERNPEGLTDRKGGKTENGELTDPSTWTESYDAKDGVLVNSGFLNGLPVKKAIERMIQELEKLGVGTGKTNYRLRDAIFSRQRYWGEPFPIYYKDGMPYAMDDSKLPLELPTIDEYKPTETGEPPLARAKNWVTEEGYPIETNTMPGFAGSSGYYFRYQDPRNDKEYFSREANDYWQNVDLYIGGAEHATGHLIYSRFWCKFLYDLGLSCKDEPFQRMINQGMIQGRSSFAYRANMEKLCEYGVWRLIKDNKLGVKFEKDFKDGRRRFDFFCPEKGILIEINRMGALERLAEPWEEYAASKGYKLLLVPIVDVVNDYLNGTDKVEQKIKDLIAGKDVPIFEEGEAYNGAPVFISKNIEDRDQFSDPIHVDINIVHNDVLDVKAFKAWRDDLKDAQFIFEKDKDGNDVYICGAEVEKMSKSMYNVQNPDDIVEKYGADTLRLYEMFLGPLEQSKPWDTQGIEGTFRFLRKFWKLYTDENNEFHVSDEPATAPELKCLHKLIKKEEEGIESISFNTVVSAFMIGVNELTDLKCNKREILDPLCVMISPYAPHIAEELWHLLGHNDSVVKATFPLYDESKTVENSFNYPISFNGKMRFNLELPVTMNADEVQAAVLAAPEAAKWIEGKQVRKVIYVPKKIVNIVVG